MKHVLLGRKKNGKKKGKIEKLHWQDLFTDFCHWLYRIVIKFGKKYNELLAEQ